MRAVRRNVSESTRLAAERRRVVIETAKAAGFLGGETVALARAFGVAFLDAARERSGVTSDTELLEYALAKVALEDDFGPRLLALKGSVAPDLDLEF